MKYYHASNHDVDKPDRVKHDRNIRSIINGNSVLGLFANTDPSGSNVYGEKLYSFELSDKANILEIDDEYRQPGRCTEYYRGVRDIMLTLGYSGIKTVWDEGESLVVFDFDVIVKWKHEGDSPH